MSDLALAWTFARRELRGGMQGFRIFFLCLLLGTAAIAGVESLSDAFLTGLRDQGQTLLGGDVSVDLVHRPATAEEHAFLDRYGRVSDQRLHARHGLCAARRQAGRTQAGRTEGGG